jgi:hypothetical protein
MSFWPQRKSALVATVSYVHLAQEMTATGVIAASSPSGAWHD